jgi:hypothetical protein
VSRTNAIIAAIKVHPQKPNVEPSAEQWIVVEEYPIAKWTRVEIGRRNVIVYLPVIRVAKGNARKKSFQQLVFVAAEGKYLVELFVLHKS